MNIGVLIIKFIWNGKKTQNSQHNIEGEKQGWRTKLQDFETYYKATIIKQLVLLLLKEQTNKSAEQKKNPRNRSTQI